MLPFITNSYASSVRLNSSPWPIRQAKWAILGTTNMASFTAGRLCFSLVALAGSVGSFISDWSVSHMFNPRWPPHAKFHNGQTLSMGVYIALAIVYFTWIKPDSALMSIEEQKECVRIAGIFGSMYWLTGLSAILYPNTAGVDPEFGKGFPQLPFFCTWWGLCGVGYWLEMRRLGNL